MNKTIKSGGLIVKLVGYGIFSSFFAVSLLIILFVLAYASETYAPFLWENRRFNVASDHFLPSAKFGWTLKPNIQINLVNEAGEYTDGDYFTSNNDGFRLTPKVNNGQNEILVLGDSFVQGYFLSNKETIPYLLAQKLKKNAINGGVGGYTTENEYLVMQEFLKLENPKVIILLFFANDLPYSSESPILQKKIEPKNKQEIVTEKYSEKSNTTLKKVNTPREVSETKICCSHKSYEKVVLDNIIRKFKNYLKLLKHPIDLASAIREDFKYIVPSQTQYGYQLNLNSPISFFKRADLVSTAFENSFKSILKMSELAKSKGIKFYIFWTPEIAQMFDKNPERDLLNKYFNENCQKLKLNCLDPTDEFRKNPTNYYIMDDGHFSPNGANLMADLIAKRVQSDLSH